MKKKIQRKEKTKMKGINKKKIKKRIQRERK